MFFDSYSLPSSVPRRLRPPSESVGDRYAKLESSGILLGLLRLGSIILVLGSYSISDHLSQLRTHLSHYQLPVLVGHVKRK